MDGCQKREYISLFFTDALKTAVLCDESLK